MQSWKTTKKANEPLQEAVSFVVKRCAFCERILRRSHIAAQKILAHIAPYASVLRRRANIAERIFISGRFWLLMPSACLFFFLFTHVKNVRLSICLRFSVMRLHFYLRLSAFLIMRLHAHSYSRIISLLFPSLFSGAFLFSPISKGRWSIFMRSLSARHSRMVAQGQFLAEFPEKQSDFLFRSAREPLFFALLSVSLHSLE